MGRKYTEEEISMILDTYMYLGYQEASKEPVELKEVIGKLSGVPEYGTGGTYQNEYRILEALMACPGAVVSRDTLMEKLWETDCYVDENTLTVNIGRLRKKLAAAGLHDFIETKKGMGYLIPKA